MATYLHPYVSTQQQSPTRYANELDCINARLAAINARLEATNTQLEATSAPLSHLTMAIQNLTTQFYSGSTTLFVAHHHMPTTIPTITAFSTTTIPQLSNIITPSRPPTFTIDTPSIPPPAPTTRHHLVQQSFSAVLDNRGDATNRNPPEPIDKPDSQSISLQPRISVAVPSEPVFTTTNLPISIPSQTSTIPISIPSQTSTIPISSQQPPPATTVSAATVPEQPHFSTSDPLPLYAAAFLDTPVNHSLEYTPTTTIPYPIADYRRPQQPTDLCCQALVAGLHGDNHRTGPFRGISIPRLCKTASMALPHTLHRHRDFFSQPQASVNTTMGRRTRSRSSVFVH